MGMLVNPYRHGGAGGSGISYAAYGHTANSLTPTYPASIASGDMLIGVVVSRGGLGTLDYTPPTGFLPLTVARSNDTQVFVYYKVAAGTESGSATFTKNATAVAGQAAYVVRFTGATKIEDVQVFATHDSSVQAISSRAVTTTVAGALVCNLIAAGSAQSVTPEAGWTEQFEDGANNVGTGSDYQLALHTLPAVGTGAQVTEEPTPSVDSTWVVVSFALCPSGSTAAQALTVRGTRSVHVNNTNSVSFTLPTGSVAGDRCIIFGGHGFTVGTPTGWYSLGQLSGSNFNGNTIEKVLSPADITAGSVTVTFGGSFYGAVAGITFAGCTGGWRALNTSRNGSGASPRTLVTDSSPVTGDYGVYFGSERASSATVTVDQGSSLQTVSNTNASAALYGGALGSSGAVTANFSYSPTGSGDYQAVVIMRGAGA